MAACHAGHPLLVRELLQAEEGRATVGHTDGNGVSALLLAARRGEPAICDILLRHGAPLGARSKAGTTALAEAAAIAGADETVALRMGFAAEGKGLPLRDVATAVHAAAAKGNAKSMGKLLAPYLAARLDPQLRRK